MLHYSLTTTTWNSQRGILVGNAGNYAWGSTPQMLADVQVRPDDPSRKLGQIIRSAERTNVMTESSLLDTLTDNIDALYQRVEA